MKLPRASLSELYFIVMLVVTIAVIWAAKEFLSKGGIGPFLLVVAPTVVMLAQTTYLAFDRVRFQLSLWTSFLAGRKAVVEITFEFGLQPDDDEKTMDWLFLAVKKWRNDASLNLKQSERLAIGFGARTLWANLSYESGSDNGELNTTLVEAPSRVINMKITGIQENVAKLRSILDDEIRTLLDTLRDHFSPKSEKYQVSIFFPDANPYFGLYVRSLPLSKISHFTCTIEEPISGEDATVNIYKNEIDVIAYKPYALVGAARRYLRAPRTSSPN